jgi:hypothetical protein
VRIPQRSGYPLYEVPRRAVPDRDLLAMFICLWRDDTGAPAVDLDWASTATAREIIDRFRASHQIDHYPVMRAWGGPDHPTNYKPLRTEPHRTKTKRDVANHAKVKRLHEDQREFRRKVLAKSSELDQTSTDQSTRPKPRWAKRKMGYRKFDGTPVRPGERSRKD